MIGERLRELRKEKKISQEELAAILNLKKSTVSLYETNKSDPSDETKKRMAHYFNVSLDYLIGVINDRVPYYTTNKFLLFPDEFTDYDIEQLDIFIEYLKYKKCR